MKSKAFVIVVCLVLAFFLLKTSQLSIKSLIDSKCRQYELSYIRNFVENNYFDGSRIYYIPRKPRYKDYATSILRLFVEYQNVNNNREFTVFSESGCYKWHEANYDNRILCKKLPFHVADSYDLIISETGKLKLDDLSGYKQYTLELPYFIDFFYDEQLYIYKSQFQSNL